MQTHEQILAFQEAVQVIKQTLDHVREQKPMSLFMNEIMRLCKVLEDTHKDMRKECTTQVDARQLILTDFTLCKTYPRSITKVQDLFMDLQLKWGITPIEMLESEVMKMQITNLEKALLKTAKHLGKVPEGVDADEWVQAETARYMTKATEPTLSLQSNSKKKKGL